MEETLKATLRGLAEKYEICSFCDEDPSQFLRWYGNATEMGAGFTRGGVAAGGKVNITDVETASFIAAMLAFGNRKQFIPKISYILELADKVSGSISKWIISGSYRCSFPTGTKKFYRFYSYDDMHDFFSDLGNLIEEGEKSIKFVESTSVGFTSKMWGAFGEALRLRWVQEEAGEKVLLADIVSSAFPHSSIVPKGKVSANKRIHMFLRWMVRQNSPVDLGIWSWYSAGDLLIPLDVHVMEESIGLGLLPENAKATRKTSIELTKAMKEIWPLDPCKGDFALFGLGVDK